MIELCCTDSYLSKNICCLLELALELGFINSFVALVPKSVHGSHINAIIFKMKTGYTFPK